MNKIITWHKNKYPDMKKEDLYTLLYQQEFGGFFLKNYQKKVVYQDLYEEISPNYVRVNLHPFKMYKLNFQKLKDLNFLTSKNNCGNILNLKKRLAGYNLSYNRKESFHSQTYIDQYLPHYLIIDKKYLSPQLKFLQAFHFLKNIRKGIIALEGKCGAGKTTLSEKLKSYLNITIINIDDFFLPPEKKTFKRLSEIGGNIDYERIKNLLINIKADGRIIYNKFNCKTNKYEYVSKQKNDLILLEGVYSYHQSFRYLIDKLIYLDIDSKTQIDRIFKRPNYQMFIDQWIPLENKYFDSLNIKYCADLII